LMKPCLVALIAGAAAVEGFSTAPLFNNGAAATKAACGPTMALSDGQMSRRAAVFTTLLGLPAAANAQFGIPLPSALRDAASRGGKRAGKVADPEADEASAESKTDAIAAKKAEREAAKAAKAAEKAAAKAAKSAPKDEPADEQPKAVDKKSKAQKKAEAKEAKKKEKPAPRVKEAPPQATEKPAPRVKEAPPQATAPDPKIEKVEKAGASGKEDGRFKDAKIDSLEEKLKKRAELKIITK